MIAEQGESADIEFAEQTDDTISLTEQNAQTNIEVIKATTEQKAEIFYIEYQLSRSSQCSITKEFLAAVLATICSSLDDNVIISQNDSYLSCNTFVNSYENDQQIFAPLPLLGAVY